MIIQGVTLTGTTVVDYYRPIVTTDLVLNLDPATSISGSTWVNTAPTGASLNYALNNNPSTATFNGLTVLSFPGGAEQTNPNYTSPYAFNSTGFGTNLDGFFGMTLDIWARPLLSTDSGALIKQWGAGSSNVPANAGIYDQFGYLGFASGDIVAGMWTNDPFNPTPQGITTGVAPFTAGNWYNIVMIINPWPTGTAVYVNNVSVGSWGNGRVPPSTNNTMFSVALCDEGGGFGTGYFTGQVGAFKIYSRALTGAEQNQNFNAMRGNYGV